MANYVMVHGGNMSVTTWNKLTVGKPVQTPDGRMGGLIWEPLVPALKAAGHGAYYLTLMDEHLADLTDNIGQVSELIVNNDLKDVILVGHSYGGMVITGLASKLSDRIISLVYVDAAFPDPGQSLFDLIKSGGADPLSFPGLEADPPYVERLEFDPERIILIPKIYIRCTKSDFSAVTTVAKKKIDTNIKGWSYFELPSSHVPMAEMPDKLAGILLKAAD